MATTKPKVSKVAAATKPAAAGKSARIAAVTSSTTQDAGLPAGFVSPFVRVEMQPGVRIDDGLCCAAMLTNRPLDEITQAAIKHGLAPHGPAWVYASLLIAILRDYGIKAEEKECPTLAALPDVALITADFNPATQYGRWVLWHHIRGTAEMQAFNYCLDPAHWIDDRLKTTTEVQRLVTPKSSIYYLECVPVSMPKAKGSAK